MRLLVAVPHDPEEHEEEVDEVKVEGEGTQDSAFAQGTAVEITRLGEGHGLDFLGVVGGKAHKNNHADIRDDHGHAGTLEEEVHNRGDDDTDEAHEHEVAHACEVLFGHHPVDAAGCKHRRTNDKGREDGRLGVDDKNGGQGGSVQGRVEHKKKGGSACLHTLDAGGDGHDHAKFSYNQPEKDHTVTENELEHGLGVCHVPSHTGGKKKAYGHPVVDTHKKGIHR